MADSWHQHVLNNMLPRMEASGEQAAGFTPAPMVVVPTQTPLSGPLSLTPNFDVVELLPPAAQEKLRALRQRGSDAHALIPPFEDIRAASMARIEAQNELKRRTDHPQDGGFNLRADDPRVVAAEKHRDKLTAEFERLRELQTARTAKWHSASAALSNAEAWLKHGRPSNAQLLDWEGEAPKLLKGEAGLLDAIENRRRRCRELRADLNRIASAPFPSGYAKAAMREIVEQAAVRGTPEVSLLIEHDRREIGWPMVRVRSEVLGTQGALAFHEVPDVVGLLAFLLKPTLISALDALVDAEKDDAAAMSHEAREQAEAEVMGDLLDVERQEAALTWQAQAQSLPCEHRADIDPRALLSVECVVAPRSAPPPTSQEHGYNVVGGRR